jgi:hypothetical protein
MTAKKDDEISYAVNRIMLQVKSACYALMKDTNKIEDMEIVPLYYARLRKELNDLSRGADL